MERASRGLRGGGAEGRRVRDLSTLYISPSLFSLSFFLRMRFFSLGVPRKDIFFVQLWKSVCSSGRERGHVGVGVEGGIIFLTV